MVKRPQTKIQYGADKVAVSVYELKTKKPSGAIVVQDRKHIAASTLALRKCKLSSSQYRSVGDVVSPGSLSMRILTGMDDFKMPEDQSFLIGPQGDVIDLQGLDTSYPGLRLTPAMHVGVSKSHLVGLNPASETSIADSIGVQFIRAAHHGTKGRPAISPSRRPAVEAMHTFSAEFVQYEDNEVVVYLADAATDWSEQLRFKESDMPRRDMQPGDQMDYQIFKIGGVIDAKFQDRLSPPVSQAELDEIDAHVDALLGEHFCEPDVTQ